MLSRAVAVLRAAEVFDRIIVSTDDDEIADVARAAGAEVPFRRPADLAGDFAGTLPVIAHAIREVTGSGAAPALVCCAYPAAVLSRPIDIRAARDLMRGEGIDYVFTATSFPYPIQRALRRTADGFSQMMWPEHREARSQDLEPAYHDAGQFYFGLSAAWLESRPIFGPRSRMLILPRNRVQDIDTLEDWERAEAIFQLSAADSTDG